MVHLFSIAFMAAVLLSAATPPSIPLFPNGVPGGKQDLGPELDMTTLKDPLVMGRPVIRVGNVTEPSLTFYPAPSAQNSTASVIVFPGGGYRILPTIWKARRFVNGSIPLVSMPCW